MRFFGIPKLLVAAALLTELPAFVTARAILGVDLGSLYMKVALVQSGSPLEIVTNLHSKRKTEQMILFDNNQRFYGADASSLLARKSQKTPAAMSVLLGRDDQHPVVEVLAERHYPVRPVYNETRAGVVMTVDGETFSPEELVAMVLSHAVDIAVAYSAESGTEIAPPKDVVLTVPSFATVAERRALLDAAALADMNVLTLIDENTAAALHYAMDKNFEDNEQLMLFYNLGASSLQVSLVKFFNYEQPQKFGKPKSVPALEVVAKAWDATCGGQAFDHLLVEHLADEFNAVWHKQRPDKADKDVRSVPRAMTKLRLQANKVKHVLSANTEIPVHMDSVHDDVSLQTSMKRSKLEELAKDLLPRTSAPVAKALAIANKTAADLTGIELVGGGMRIPSVQTELQKTIGDNMELGMHINADESFALGAAFAGANISTAFRVRHVGLTDINPFAMQVALSDLPSETAAAAAEEEAWNKEATIFKEFGKIGVKKTIAFTHDRDVHCELDYVESDLLPKGTERTLERYNISGVEEFAKEMIEKGLGKPKVSLQFELSSSGIVSLLKAEAAVEETYTVEEEVEVDDEEGEGEGEEPKEGDEKKEAEEEEKKEAEEETEKEEKKEDEAAAETDNETKAEEEKPKKKKKIMVEKIFGIRRGGSPAFIRRQEKKKMHKKQLSVKTYYIGRVQPHSEELLAASKAKLLEMAEKDKARMMLEESRNRVESYIYKIKNKLIDDEETIEKFTNKKQREEVSKLAEAAHEWLDDDGYDADLATMEDKYAELSVPFERIMLRISESTARPETVEAVRKKLTEIEGLMEKWVEAKPQVTEEERKEVLDKVTEARKWIDDKESAQSKKKPHDDPVFFSTEVPLQLKPIETLVVRLNRKPKPKPKKVEKNETTTNTTDDSNTTTATANETEAGESEASPAEGDATTEEAKVDEETPQVEETTTEETKTQEEPPESTEEAASAAEEEPVKEQPVSEEL